MYSRTKNLAAFLVLAMSLAGLAPLAASDLVITGVVDGPLTGGTPKAVEFYATANIADLSIYGFGSANNGGGSDGEEFTFPAIAVTAGTYLYVASESTQFTNFFGFAPHFTSSAANINGDDAIELFQSAVIADVLGDINLDGTGQPWEHLDGWAYRVDGTGPDGGVFDLGNWTFSGPNALDGETSNDTAVTPFPIGTYALTPQPNLLITGVVDGPLSGGTPKAIEFYATGDIADLSTYGFGSANNGGGTDGEEFTFPSMFVAAGTYLYAASESVQFANFFGFAPDFTSSAASINGDDAIELFFGGAVADVFGDINVDGTGQPWEHLDGWAYRVAGTGPDGSTFVLANWTFSGINALDGEVTNGTAAIPFPIGSYATPPPAPAALLISGVVDGPLPGGLPKAVEFFAFDDIADLSTYGFGSANNGGGTDGEEFTFPAVGVTAGTYIYVASESTNFASFFGFAPDYTNSAANINGDDAIELFQNGAVIDVFGDINVDGSGQPWEYLDGWAYRVDATGPDGSTFVLANWTFSGPNALDGELTNAGAATPFPIGTYSVVPPAALLISGVVDGPLSGGVPKAVEFFAVDDIADLSLYGFGSANNGGGTDGQEFTFPAVAVSAGSFVYVASESTGFTSFFGFAPDYTSGASNINGDDAIELFLGGVVIDVFGDINVDGSGQPWEYLDGWAYRVNGTGPDGSTFVLGNWTFSGPNALDGETTNAGAATPFPIGSYLGSGENAPRVDSTSPTNGAGDAEVDDDVVITFSEDVNVAGAWFSISCTTSGAHTATVSGGPLTFTLDPDVDFADGEICTVTVFAAQVTDVDLDDPPDNMTADAVFSFSTPVEAEIFEIQGSGAFSPFVGLSVRTRDNVVTGVRTNGFFMQTPDARSDADAATSDGIFVFTGGAPGVAPGNLVDVTGTIVEFFNFTEYNNSGLTVAVTSIGNPQPTPVLLGALNPDPGPFDPPDMERLEGMLVELVNGVATGPTDGFGDTSVAVGPNRTFREPGIEFPSPFPMPPEWDGNQEVFEVDPDGLAGMADFDIFATQSVSAIGPLAFSFGDYQILPQALVLGPDPGVLQPVRERDSGEFTVGSFNIFRLNGGFAKLSAYVTGVLRSPDILAIQEVQDIVELQNLAAQIAIDDPSVVYTASLIEGNDIGGIDVGFLTRQNIQIDSVTQVDPDVTFVNPVTLEDNILHDRPPLLLEGSCQLEFGSFPIAVMAVHNRSLSSIEDPVQGVRVRKKRFLQAVSIAEKVAALQTADPDVRLVVTGDFNAYEFTDGYVDAVGVITGEFVAGDNLVCQTENCAGLPDNDLFDETLGLPAAERYSFVFGGNAQVLDHALTSAGLAAEITSSEYGRGNADAYNDLLSDVTPANLPLRSSDHDGLVVFIAKDEDADGVPNDDDVCAGTMIPEDVPTSGLKPNRYALVDGDGIFDTVTPPGGGAGDVFTLGDTAGCSCEQIIEAQGLGNGHTKHGCSVGAMRNWVDLVNP